MPSRWKNDRPLSRAEFAAHFPDDAACARYLAARRWPGGFVCPCCDEREGWELRRERITWQCTSCGRQTFVTAGTVTVRHRTVRTKGALSQKTAKLMVFTLIQAASKKWLRLKGRNQLPKLIEGIKFNDGIEVTDANETCVA